MNLDPDRPALLGGRPVCPGGPPDWPPPDDDVAEVLRQLAVSGGWGRYHGPHCEQLAQSIRELHGCSDVLLCSSGTAAVELALRGGGVGPGDEVLLAAYDFKANFVNVLALGAIPALVDIREDDFQLDAALLDAASSERTRAIIVSHLHGGLVDMPAVRQWADARGVFVIEDACQAHGAMVQGRAAGMWGDVGVWSFGGSKLLSAGRGGAIYTNRGDVAQRIRLYTQRGNDAYPLSEMQAAVLGPQLQKLADRHARRLESVAKLRDQLGGQHGLRPPAAAGAGDSPAYYKLGLWFAAERAGGLSRERFAEAMQAEGIALHPGFRGLHRIHARSRFQARTSLQRAEQADENLLVLHHPVLLTGEIDAAPVAAAKILAHAAELR